MDTPSQHVFSFLDAISTATDRIYEFVHALAREIEAREWGGSGVRRLSISGSPFSIHKQESVERFDRHLSTGTWIGHPRKSRAIIFGMSVAYRADAWLVQAAVEDEIDAGVEHQWLWQSDEYWSDTLDDALRSLEKATAALFQSRTHPPVAALLEEMRRGFSNA
jgi:hypothetical protein